MDEYSATQLVMLRAFLIEASPELARLQADAPNWVHRFMARIQERVDWLEAGDRELRGFASTGLYERARLELGKLAGYLRELLR